MKKKSFASSQQGPQRRLKLNSITPTEEITKELAALKKRKINSSHRDAREIATWDKAVVGKFYRPIKKQITLRIDADVLEWFRDYATKYQPLINTACREYMLAHEKTSKK